MLGGTYVGQVAIDLLFDVRFFHMIILTMANIYRVHCMSDTTILSNLWESNNLWCMLFIVSHFVDNDTGQLFLY